MTRFSGSTGPETVRGQWSQDGREIVVDESRKYTVALPHERVDELLTFLRQVGNTFDQRAICVEITGYAEVLEVSPEDGVSEV